MPKKPVIHLSDSNERIVRKLHEYVCKIVDEPLDEAEDAEDAITAIDNFGQSLGKSHGVLLKAIAALLEIVELQGPNARLAALALIAKRLHMKFAGTAGPAVKPELRPSRLIIMRRDRDDVDYAFTYDLNGAVVLVGELAKLYPLEHPQGQPLDLYIRSVIPPAEQGNDTGSWLVTCELGMPDRINENNLAGLGRKLAKYGFSLIDA